VSGGAGAEQGSPGSARTVVGPVPQGRSPESYDRLRRRVLWAMPTGLYVVGSRGHLDGTLRHNLMTASLVVQVATEPKLVAVAIETESVTSALVTDSGCFAISLLRREDRALVRRFVKPVGDVNSESPGRPTLMNGEEVWIASSGAPVLRRAPAYIDCDVRHRLPLGSHVLFIGEVTDAGGADGEVELPEALEVLRMEDTRMSYGG
jgi:flavin reductase (DIM6/NTAB) family NADH-FMN oxidoreductase RutF